MKNAINRPTRVNVLSWAACAALAASLGLPSVAAANDTQAENLEFIIVSDDIRKEVTPVARAAGSDSSSPAAPDGSSADTGQSNNGHGNNADGVDSSNPGQGGGGPTGAVDPSGSVDDEAGGGGALPSKSNNGKGNGKNK